MRTREIAADWPLASEWMDREESEAMEKGAAYDVCKSADWSGSGASG